MKNFNDLKCSYMNHKKSKKEKTLYYCDYDDMGFDSMTAHCKNCPMYDKLMKRAFRLVFGD